jgi:cellulose biosynthesis protein BcsQ
MPIKVAVFNRKGGVGKTTLSIILTQIALMHGKKVLGVDQDEQANYRDSISYLTTTSEFKESFTLKTSLIQEDFARHIDWIIVDCPPAFNDRSRFAIRNADFIVIPVNTNEHSLTPFKRIMQEAGDYKKLFQFPLVKVGFMEGTVHDKTDAAKAMSREIARKGYTVIGDMPVYAKINSNLTSGLQKWWCTGLQALARQYFEEMYRKLERLYSVLQQYKQEGSNNKPEQGDKESSKP